ncbi:hypothetical protein PUN28_007996 [Cardiocondyla obscurior]|uniref:Uncharacterized protein n=1 Tax=Cardiocondyla obscurior TaxID=286306 RepID=A0AAW2FZ35_9HYME
MTEPETETEDETVASEFLDEAKLTIDTDVTDDTTTESDQSNIKYGSAESEAYGAKSYAEPRSEPVKKDGRKTVSDIARLLGAETVEETFPLHEGFPLGGFQLEQQTRTTVGLDRRRRTRIWRSMRAKQPTRVFRKTEKVPRYRRERLWPTVWPCVTRDEVNELEARGKERKRRRDVFPCDPVVDENEILLRERKSDFANRKELGHVRASAMSHPKPKRKTMDRAVGERPGLVDGDYVIVELPTGRVYAYVVLRGLKGMHLLEMSSLRERRNTWKFCFYQAVVALLARTQLRYKYAWSANVDYIYDHAWMLFTHIGTINVRVKQRLDDVVVYNYKYSVEMELVREIKNVVARNVDVGYMENGLRRQIALSRKDPLRVRAELGYQKVADSGYIPVHEDIRELEEWFGELTAQYRDCILRTARFSLAFWQDGFFWYLFNPYRCDEYGFWEDHGRACIVKFCSADSLRRHLMILLLRGHAYEVPRSRFADESDVDVNAGTVHFDVQIFHVSIHCCQLDNLKLLQRGAEQSRRVDDRPSDTLEVEDETDLEEDDEEDDPREPREKVSWLKHCRATTWSKCAPANRKKSAEVSYAVKPRWHQYYVEEPNRLFSLWGETHPTDNVFDEANRGMQTYACYVVCAGMTMITAPEYWSPQTLDAIVVCGDRYYTRSKYEAEMKSASEPDARSSSEYLSDRFEIGEILLEARMLPAVRGKLYAGPSECLWRTLERVLSSYHFAVLTCESACLGLFKFCGTYYMCDVNSYGPPLFRYGHGVAYLLRATSFRKFVTVLVLTISSPERSQFSLNPIEILKIVEMDTAPKSGAETRERVHRFGKLVRKVPGKLPGLVLDRQKKKQIKKVENPND